MFDLFRGGWIAGRLEAAVAAQAVAFERLEATLQRGRE